MKTRLTFIFSCLLFIQFSFTQNNALNDTLSLPFSEDWTSGSFILNGWQADSDNWYVETDAGNPKPSVVYSSQEKADVNYNDLLESEYLNASQLTDVNIWLDFQIKLEDIESGSNEFLKVLINNGEDWNSVFEQTNQGNTDWDSIHIDITDYALGEIFKIGFEASGENNNNFNRWLIDNIKVYRTCIGGHNLAIDIDTVGDNLYVVSLTWELFPLPIKDSWVRWDDGINYEGFGTDCNKNTAAVRWTANQLSYYDGFKISKLQYYFNDTELDYLKPMVWQGAGAEELIYSDSIAVESLIVGWNTIDINPPLTWNSAEELWIGYECAYQTGVFPMGIDDGPASNGYGNMFKCDDGDWGEIPGGYDNNFNMAMYLSDNSGVEKRFDKNNKNETRGFSGFNLYGSVNGGGFVFLSFIEWIDGTITYQFPEEGTGALICYMVTAVWESETDYCESAPFTARDNPDEDFVCYLLTGNQADNKHDLNQINIFPNPATHKINIHSSSEMKQVELINLLSQTVFKHELKTKEQSIDISKFEKGIYIIRIETDQGVVNKRVVIGD